MTIWHVYRVIDDSTSAVIIHREVLVLTTDDLSDAQHFANQYAGDNMRIREQPERRAVGYRTRSRPPAKPPRKLPDPDPRNTNG